MEAKGKPETHEVRLEGSTLRRGFWLYVWEVTSPTKDKLLYVGRTGDNSTPKAASPFNRMGQHLGSVEASNTLRKHLLKRDLDPEDCSFRFVAHGPILPEAESWEEHVPRRHIIGGLEQRLEQELRHMGWDVLNLVNGTFELDEKLWEEVWTSFAERLPLDTDQ
jgi:hypothetical protein